MGERLIIVVIVVIVATVLLSYVDQNTPESYYKTEERELIGEKSDKENEDFIGRVPYGHPLWYALKQYPQYVVG
jgi:hypothetical protein